MADAFFGVDNTFLTQRARRGPVRAVHAPRGSTACPTTLAARRRSTASRRSTAATCASTTTSPGSATTGTRPRRRRSPTWPSPSTGSCSWSRTRRRRRPGSRSCSRRSSAYGDDGWQDYWKALRDNGVRVVDGWEQAYYTDFTAGGGERRPSARRVVRDRSRGRRRVLRRQEDDADRRRRARHVLRAGRVRGRAHERAATRPARGRSIDFMLTRAVPGRTSRCRCTCIPAVDGHAAADGVHASSRRSRRVRTR